MRWLLVSLVLAAMPALAQEVPPNFEVRLEKSAQPLTLKAAVKLGLDQNQEVLKARNTVDRAEAGLRAARAAWLPTLNATSGYTGLGASAVTSSSDSVSVQGTVAWTAFDASRQAQVDTAQLRLQRASLDLKTRERDIALRITTAYFDLQRADSDLEIQDSAVRNAQANLTQISKRQQAGLATRFDVLQQQVQLANSRQRLLAARNEQARNQLVLADLLNLSQSLPARASDPIEPGADWSPTLAVTLTKAVEQRPELTAFVRDQDIARAQQVVNNGQLLPRLTVSAGYGFTDNLRGFNQAQSTLSANLNWQIYDGGASVARQEQLEYDRRNAVLDYSLQAQRIRVDLERAYLAKETAKAQIESAQVAVNQATESLELVRRRRQLGLSLQVEVINAEQALTEARQNYANAVISYNRSLAELALVVGI